ncbi:MAG: hypothetical protein JOY71_05680 [Acetobacteraceae bacterium]|nr:hypothetical protein [Acetobacteraceae bacterium]
MLESPGSAGRPPTAIKTDQCGCLFLTEGSPVEGLFSKMARSMLRHIRVGSRAELKARILAYLEDANRDPIIHKWTYKIAEAA